MQHGVREWEMHEKKKERFVLRHTGVYGEMIAYIEVRLDELPGSQWFSSVSSLLVNRIWPLA